MNLRNLYCIISKINLQFINSMYLGLSFKFYIECLIFKKNTKIIRTYYLGTYVTYIFRIYT